MENSNQPKIINLLDSIQSRTAEIELASNIEDGALHQSSIKYLQAILKAVLWPVSKSSKEETYKIRINNRYAIKNIIHNFIYSNIVMHLTLEFYQLF